MVRFGVPTKVVIDNASYFSSIEITEFYFEYGVKINHSSYYFLQGNGQVASSNNKVVNILRKLVLDNHKTWHKKIHEGL